MPVHILGEGFPAPSLRALKPVQGERKKALSALGICLGPSPLRPVRGGLRLPAQRLMEAVVGTWASLEPEVRTSAHRKGTFSTSRMCFSGTPLLGLAAKALLAGPLAETRRKPSRFQSPGNLSYSPRKEVAELGFFSLRIQNMKEKIDCKVSGPETERKDRCGASSHPSEY